MTAFTMRSARRRYRREKVRASFGLSFRAWARRTYNPHGAAGKLAHLVRGRGGAA